MYVREGGYVHVSESVCESERECVRECVCWGRGWRIYRIKQRSLCQKYLSKVSLVFTTMDLDSIHHSNKASPLFQVAGADLRCGRGKAVATKLRGVGVDTTRHVMGIVNGGARGRDCNRKNRKKTVCFY